MTSPAPALIRDYMRATGWNQRRFAQACGLDPATLNLLLRGHRSLSIQSALLIQQGTEAAKVAGLVTVDALSARELVPELATLTAAPPAAAKAG